MYKVRSNKRSTKKSCEKKFLSCRKSANKLILQGKKGRKCVKKFKKCSIK